MDIEEQSPDECRMCGYHFEDCLCDIGEDDIDVL